MLKEVTSENHPAHIAGNGPEQAQGFGTMDDEMFLLFCKQHSKVKCNEINISPCLSSRTQSYISFCNSSIYTMCKFLLMCLQIRYVISVIHLLGDPFVCGYGSIWSQELVFPEYGISLFVESVQTQPKTCGLMKASRLSRPGIIKPTNDLATVQSWSKGDDKRLLRLIQYIDSTPHHRLVGTINDSPEQLGLRLYVDADFAGVRLSAKSTSGVFLILYGPNTIFPLAWVSKRQTSTSRSTTESESCTSCSFPLPRRPSGTATLGIALRT